MAWAEYRKADSHAQENNGIKSGLQTNGTVKDKLILSVATMAESNKLVIDECNHSVPKICNL